MAYIRQHTQHTQVPLRPQHKDPDWSSFCDNVFEQYLDDDDLFGLGHNQARERSSSDDSVNLFDFSGSSEQSNQTDGTSPIPTWEQVEQRKPVVEAKQPKAQESVDFWQKTLRALEQNAAESEKKQQTLRTTKSHPDFLSLGGCPSPPALPPSPTIQSLSVQRRQVSRHAANGKRTPSSAVRSVSRGRPVGVSKAAPANPYATIRKVSTSPHKMMNPSRYRAGFKDIWADKLESSPKKYQLRVPSHPFPESPPPSDRLTQEDFAAFSSPAGFAPLAAYDADLSPLTTTFQQQARIHTPAHTPQLDQNGHLDNSYFDGVPALPPNPYEPQTVPLNDTSPIFPERTSSLAHNRIGSFDFGFASDANASAWNANSFTNNHYTTDLFTDPFVDLSQTILPSTEPHDPLLTTGLGISCDPSLVSNSFTHIADIAPLSTPNYTPTTHALSQPPQTPYYLQRHGLPTTPQRDSTAHLHSLSPSPPHPHTAPRSSRPASSSRRSTSKHRRAKSASATPRNTQRQAQTGDGKAGFVNFTPSDSGIILSGVAPSGSSKTKARREKEAADKRRRLGQAAVRAVVEAGGDLEGLERVGIFG